MAYFNLPTLAGHALVLAVATDSWDTVRDRVSRLFGRGQPDPEVEQWLDSTRRRLSEAPGSWQLREEIADLWRARFTDLLADYPPAEAELSRLLDDLPEEAVWQRFQSAEKLPRSFAASGALEPHTDSWAVIETSPPKLAAAPAPATDPEPAAPSEPRAQAATTSLPDDPVVAAIRAAVKPGVLAFNPPPVMTQGRRERVEVGIGRSPELRAALLEGLRGHGEVQFEEVPTSMLMGVELRGSSFEIEAFSPLEQVVAPTARWEFDVRPLRLGLQTLSLCVSMRVDALVPPPGAAGHLAAGHIGVPVLERQIRIRVSVGYGTRTFLVGNWRWLIATGAAIAMAAAAWATIVH
jgi:hypothetical protein